MLKWSIDQKFTEFKLYTSSRTVKNDIIKLELVDVSKVVGKVSWVHFVRGKVYPGFLLA